jgi:hypothetical protein
MTETPRKKTAAAAKAKGGSTPKPNAAEENQPSLTMSDAAGPRRSRRAAGEPTPQAAPRQLEEPLQPRDVEPPTEPEELAEHDSYTPPSHPNTAASNEEPKELTRPETKQERRDRRAAEVEEANAE